MAWGLIFKVAWHMKLFKHAINIIAIVNRRGLGKRGNVTGELQLRVIPKCPQLSCYIDRTPGVK